MTSTARPRARTSGPVRPAGARSAGAARTPFVLLVVVLLAGGLIVLLMLNSALNAGSFELSELRKDTTSLTEERQELQRDVDEYSAPGALQRRARELGLAPGGSPLFLFPDGTLRGVPGEAVRPQTRSLTPAAPDAPAVPDASVTPAAPVPPSAPTSSVR